MQIKTQHILSVFLLLAIGFYLGFIRFLGRFLGFGGTQGDLEAAAAGNPVNQAAALLLLLMSIGLLLKSAGFSIKALGQQAWVFAIIIAFFTASLLWTATPFVSLRRVVAFTTMVLVCLVLVNTYTLRSLLSLIAHGIVAAIAIGFVYQLLSGQTIAFGLGDRASGFRGIFSDKNAAARVYAYGLLLFVGLGKYRRPSDIACLCLILIALMVSQSASAIILASLGTGLILMFKLLRGRYKQQNIFRLLLIFVLLVVGVMVITVIYEYVLNLLGRDANLTNRAIIWELIMPYIEDKPLLGYGFGSFWASGYVADFVERWGFIGNAHSGYLEAMLMGGIFAFLLLMLLIIWFLRLALKNYVQQPIPDDFAELFLAICIVQCVINYIAFIILNHNSVDMFIFLIAFFSCGQVVKNKRIQHT